MSQAYESENTPPLLWWLGRLVAGEDLIDHGIPFLAVAVLPDQLHQPRAGAQRAPDVGERGHRIGEEHGAEPTDGKVEAPSREAVGLGVGLHEADIAQALCAGKSAGPGEPGRGDVYPHRAAGGRSPDRFPRGLPRPAADVQDAVGRPDPGGGTQMLVVAAQSSVIVEQVTPARQAAAPAWEGTGCRPRCSAARDGAPAGPTRRR
jgi:hypothetical protein